MIPVPDFSKEALLTAINEACDLNDADGLNCNIDKPCKYCANLAKAIEIRLVKAFVAGQQTTYEPTTLRTPHRA
jgi:hypothetical protein